MCRGLVYDKTRKNSQRLNPTLTPTPTPQQTNHSVLSRRISRRLDDIKVVQAQPQPGAAELARVALARETAVGVADVPARRGASVADDVEVVAAPALAAVLDARVPVGGAHREAVLDRHVLHAVLNQFLQHAPRGRLLHARVVREVDVAGRHDGRAGVDRGRGRGGRGGG